MSEKLEAEIRALRAQVERLERIILDRLGQPSTIGPSHQDILPGQYVQRILSPAELKELDERTREATLNYRRNNQF